MATEVVLALYRPREGGEGELRRLLAKHIGTLRDQGLASDRPSLLLRSRSDGSYLEIFEWVSSETVERAHDDPVVQAIWRQMADVAEFASLASLEEAHAPFPHFDVVDDLGDR